MDDIIQHLRDIGATHIGIYYLETDSESSTQFIKFKYKDEYGKMAYYPEKNILMIKIKERLFGVSIDKDTKLYLRYNMNRIFTPNKKFDLIF